MKPLVHPKEKLYYTICLVISIILYIVAVISIVGISYILMGALAFLFMHGMLIGGLKGNGVKITEQQFPHIYQTALKLSKDMGMAQLPDLYLLQSGGVLNAFATRFLGRDFVVIYSDVLELAYEQGEEAVNFILCHELAHIQQKHLSKRALLIPSTMVPFLGTAYSRACEYTCDMIAGYHVPKGSVAGLMVLSSGKRLYAHVNVDAYIRQAQTETGFWVWFAEINSTHPNLPKRIARMANELPTLRGTAFENPSEMVG